MKKIDKSAHTGDGGIALIHRRVYEMGHVWHERKLDAGIDGEVEIRDPDSGEVYNRILLVQSKARTGTFPGETADSFHYVIDQRDLDGWMAADNPVLLVCSHPVTGDAWWAHVQGQFADPARRRSRRIEFNKHTQRFDASAAARVRDLADPQGRAVVPAADHRPEVLISNLLTVEVPSLLYASATDFRHPSAVYKEIREADEAPRLDWVLRDGKLYTLVPPDETSLRLIVTGPTDLLSASDWLDVGDDALERRYVELLNRALQQDLKLDCTYHRGRNLLYFRPTADLSERKIIGAHGVPCGVFWPRTNKEGRVTHYKHAALSWQFLRLSNGWYCEIVPDWHFTRDGYRDSKYLASNLSGLKRMDRNRAVLSQMQMWAKFLGDFDDRDTPSLFDPDPEDRDRTLAFGDLATFSVDRGVDDAAWLADPRTPTSPPEVLEADPHNLFEAS
jgi:hypothetical protein